MTISNSTATNTISSNSISSKSLSSNLTLLIDNYDSFTWNVFQALSLFKGSNVKVIRNDQMSLENIIKLNPKRLVISPGPGYPSSAGISNNLIKYYAGKIPILGVCLGEQCMYEVYGGKVVPCGELIHGKTTPVEHDGLGLFSGVDQNIECTRYHSLAGDPKTLPDCLSITAWTESGIVMGVRHKQFVMEGVQFHPESISSEQGQKLFANFMSWDGGNWKDLTIHPEWIHPIIPFDTSSPANSTVGKGIPLNQASKMNSTSRTNQPTSSSSSKSLSILQKIYAQRKIDISVEKLQIGNSLEYLERCYALGLAPKVIDFKARLQSSINQYGSAVIAEIKRASPSKGDIDSLVHAPQQALLYAKGGASAVSVLTEPTWFKGNLNDLKDIRKAFEGIPNRPAILRKEFIFDVYQVLQARLAGADTVLLIVAMLNDAQLLELMEYSRTLGMEPLVEVASPLEMKRALEAGATVIGVNNRDLNTFQVDMNRTSDLSSMVSQSNSVVLLALSGITCRDDVERYSMNGAKGVLVGESLMKSVDKVQAVGNLLGVQQQGQTISTLRKKPLVKICGLTSVKDAVHAKESGADFLGLIFAPESPRFVGIETASEISMAVKGDKTLFTPFQGPFKTAPGIQPKEWFSTQSHSYSAASRPLVVGVFTNQTVQEINDIADKVGLDFIQLHTPKPLSFYRLLNRPVVAVIGIDSSSNTINVVEMVMAKCKLYAGLSSSILLDTTTTSAVGGTGKTFNWGLVNELNGVPVWMAGGLDPSNVKDAVNIAHPLVVDVCSGVEVSKGVKDHVKVKSFIYNAQN